MTVLRTSTYDHSYLISRNFLTTAPLSVANTLVLTWSCHPDTIACCNYFSCSHVIFSPQNNCCCKYSSCSHVIFSPRHHRLSQILLKSPPFALGFPSMAWETTLWKHDDFWNRLRSDKAYSNRKTWLRSENIGQNLLLGFRVWSCRFPKQSQSMMKMR